MAPTAATSVIRRRRSRLARIKDGREPSTRLLSRATPGSALAAALGERRRQPIAGRRGLWPRPAGQLREPQCLLTAAAAQPVPGSARGGDVNPDGAARGRQAVAAAAALGTAPASGRGGGRAARPPEEAGVDHRAETSTSGTVINKLKVVKKQTCPLQTGDVIYLVYRKNEPEHNVAYLYESLNEKQGMTQESFGSGGGGISPKGSGPSVASDEVSSFASALPDRKTASFSSLEPQDQEDLEPLKKKMRGDGDLDLNGQLLVAQPRRNAQTVHEDVRAAAGKPDKMEETLTCIICQDLLHDCVSLQPCMHTFCAACYSGWMERSSLCPTCRCPVERICKNHILNNLVEAYLIQHPDKSRSEEDVQSMDARNKITQDMLQPKVRRSFSDEEGSSEDLLELSDVDSESSDISQPYVVCRQCPEYRRQAAQPPHCPAPEGEPGAPQALGDAPSTSVSLTTAVQDYVCPLQGSHALCTCCFQPMPDRRAEREQDPRVAPQQCAVCLQPFCHLYWGCTRTGCYGCLAPFCELNLGDKCLDGVLNNNSYESDILKNYLATRGLTWKNMLTESLVALQQGVFLLSDYRVTGDTVLCYCCGLRSFRELTYQYRQNIPTSELPVAVTSRPDCYWGRNCRTQVKAHHAMKFNHICEQTRFKN
ncbi:E3 ubiquitin-protein ligase CHFR isoform X19 [Gorilla gorilla gorilla]|uniref:E3 ubiquitin-protein ligase CHFR isoform X19 n=1 Tax=Gorilla gorilla gorilla TaxID=9595 RepID=UPI002445D5AF|nr:E3 ubiquitin-protein ligase CHFR isoform X20 [Gorilla gorilla gorilla]